MDRKIIILLIGLIISIIFHALTVRFDVVKGDESAVFRIDRLTGKMWVCAVAPGGAGCMPLKELPGR